MKFNLDDGGGYQTITIKDGDKPGDVKIDIVSAEDVTSVIESNKRAQNSGEKQMLGNGTETSMFKMGELSALKAYQLMQSNIFWDDKALRKWFSDLDNYLWRVTRKARRTKCPIKSTN